MIKSFVQNQHNGSTTLTEIIRVRNEISANDFFGCFAYATQSGFRTFELSVGKAFWQKTNSRWLFGIDYGRTDPRALKEIASRDNAEVRIYDGCFVAKQSGFAPRRDYHPKVAMLKNTTSTEQGMVVGSGNFSNNGLRRSVEAGTTLVSTQSDKLDGYIEPVRSIFEQMWAQASLLKDIAQDYENNFSSLVSSRDSIRPITIAGSTKAFWIEAGYVTKNRGQSKPGNQIFAPNGFRKHFGLKKKAGNSTNIGEITFETVIGPTVTKNYRENDNGMEKLTLPMPEDHGFEVYDGKVLIFEPRGTNFLLTAVELEDFELIYGHRTVAVERMAGGRRFGMLV